MPRNPDRDGLDKIVVVIPCDGSWLHAFRYPLRVLSASARHGRQTRQPLAGSAPTGINSRPLSRISTANIRRLGLAWTYDIGETGRRFEAMSIIVDNVLSAGLMRTLYKDAMNSPDKSYVFALGR